MTPVIFLAGLMAKGLLILLAAAIAVRALRGASSAARHAVWTAGMVALLFLPVFVEVGPAMRIPGLADVIAQPFTRFHVRGDPTIAPPNRSGIVSAGNHVGERALDAVSPIADSTKGQRADGLPVLLFLTWIMGGIALAGRDMVHFIRAHRVVARSTRVTDAKLLRLKDELRNRLQIRRAVGLAESDEVNGPATFGVFQPVVLLPVGASAWPASAARTVLAHEMAHVARNDCLTDTLAHLARSVHWLNPIVWVAVRRMRLERERACDDRVLETGVSPEPYATLLLDVARRALREASGERMARTAALAMANSVELETRLLAIFDSTVPRGSLRRGQRIVLAAAATAASVLIASVRLEAARAIAATGIEPSEHRPQVGARFEDKVSTSRLGNRPIVAEGGPDRVSTRAAIEATRSAKGAREATGIAQALPQRQAPEPDTRQDSVAHPRSERVAGARLLIADALKGYDSALSGPDSALARRLRRKLDQVPRWEGDLVAERAMWALTRVGDGLIVESMVDALADDDWRVRAYAAWVLGEAGSSAARDRRTTAALIAALSHPIWRLRAMAAHALAEIGDPAARVAMVRRLDDEAWQVRVSAVRYLGSLGDQRLVSTLERLKGDRHIAVRGAAATAIASLSTRGQ